MENGNHVFLSIIIPVYNTEKYVKSTLDSIYTQINYPFDFEVVVVDDGTPDNAMDIVKNYQRNKNNLDIIHQENKGLSAARNTGLSQAKGEYIWYVDSDDTIPKDAFEKIYSRVLDMKEANTFIFSTNEVFEENNTRKISSPLWHKRDNKLFYQSCSGMDLLYRLNGTPIQRFVFLRSFLIENALWFTPDLLHEDCDILYRILFFSDTVVVCPDVIYNYLLRTDGSITSTFNIKRILAKERIVENILKFKTEHATTMKQKYQLNNYAFNMVVSLYDIHTRNPLYFAYIHKNNLLYKQLLMKLFFLSLPLISLGKIMRLVMISISFKLYRKVFLS